MPTVNIYFGFLHSWIGIKYYVGVLRWANVSLLIGPPLTQHVGFTLAQHVKSSKRGLESEEYWIRADHCRHEFFQKTPIILILIKHPSKSQLYQLSTKQKTYNDKNSPTIENRKLNIFLKCKKSVKLQPFTLRRIH